MPKSGRDRDDDGLVYDYVGFQSAPDEVTVMKSESEETNRPVSSAEEKGIVRKPYEKPAFRFERVFETIALACGKVQTTQSGCKANRKAS